MKISGYIEAVIYNNEDTGYSVLSVSAGKTFFTLVGNFISIKEGEYIEAEVEKVVNKKYGEQYEVKSYNISFPSEIDAIEKYLASDEFPGIGPKFAKAITSQFGEETFDVIENEPERLFEVKGMNYKRHQVLVDFVSRKTYENEITLKLYNYDLSRALIKNIIDTYKEQTLEIIKTNPYRLAMDITGMGFVKCDEIAERNGISKNSKERYKAGIIFTLTQAYYNGHVYLTRDELINKLFELLKVEKNEVNIAIMDDSFAELQMDRKIIVGNFEISENEYEFRVFLYKAYTTEDTLSKLLLERRNNIEIITGGPGTGKTYNIKKLLREIDGTGGSVLLLAPTGRAAKRMTEVTGYEAKTIHRGLGFQRRVNDDINKNDDEDNIKYNFNEENHLKYDYIIVDEMSMVGEELMLRLIKATSLDTKIFLVGDVDQLPPVSAGNVLKDMIDSDLFKVEFLTQIFRQDMDSDMVMNAHKVNHGEEIDITKKSKDFKFKILNNDEDVKKYINKIVRDVLPEYFNTTLSEIQVICPSRKGNCGVVELNKILQNTLNPKKDNNEIIIGDNIFRVNDKIMQIKNDYDINWSIYDKDDVFKEEGFGLFNGDIGVIKSINKYEGTITCVFDDKEVELDKEQMKNLTLAYAITVHKSQGSEYDVVVMPMTPAPRPLMNRKLLYTGMTRAKKCMVFVGSENIFKSMENNVEVDKRNSALLHDNYRF